MIKTTGTISALEARDIMTRELITVECESSLREVIETLTAYGVSGAPVISGGRVVGVISRSDILEFIVSAPGVPSETPQFNEWGEYVDESAETDADEDPVAFFTDLWDDAGADVVERFAEPQGPEWDILAEHTADALMTRKLEAVTPETPITEIARKLVDRRVHRLLVIENGSLAGIVSATDLVRVVAGIE
jgi:CBS domain-containing protein